MTLFVILLVRLVDLTPKSLAALPPRIKSRDKKSQCKRIKSKAWQ